MPACPCVMPVQRRRSVWPLPVRQRPLPGMIPVPAPRKAASPMGDQRRKRTQPAVARAPKASPAMPEAAKMRQMQAAKAGQGGKEGMAHLRVVTLSDNPSPAVFARR